MTKSKYNPQIHHRRSIRLKGYDYSQAGLYFVTICCEDRECRFGHIENDKMILNEFGNIAYNEWIKLTERFTNFELDVFQIMPNHMHGIIFLNPVGAGFTPALNSNPNQMPAPNPNNISIDENNTSRVNSNNISIRENHTSRIDENHTSVNSNNTSRVHEKNISVDSNNKSPINSNNISRVNSNNLSVHSNNTPTINEKGQPRGFAPTTIIGDIVGAYKSLSANGCLKIYKCKNETMGKLWQRNYY